MNERDSTEIELMKQLGIQSWRNLSKDKFMTFVSSLPALDKEVALGIVAQFPNFKELAQGAFKQLEADATQARTFNWKSQKAVHKAFAEYREALNRELERDDLTAEDRYRILEMLKEAVDREAAKDSENKQFLLRYGVIGAMVIAAIFVTGLAALGGNTGITGEGGTSPSA